MGYKAHCVTKSFWADDSPNDYIQYMVGNIPTVNVQVRLTKSIVYSDATVKGQIYLDVLQQLFEPHFYQDKITSTVLFQ